MKSDSKKISSLINTIKYHMFVNRSIFLQKNILLLIEWTGTRKQIHKFANFGVWKESEKKNSILHVSDHINIDSSSTFFAVKT